MNLESQGKILRGGGGTVLCGKRGTILCAGRELPVFVEVWIEWDTGDIDVCGLFSRFPVESAEKVGWGWSSRAQTPKSYADWMGDKTAGGPEHIWIGPRPINGNRWLDYTWNLFRIYLNQYSATASASATIRARDHFGNELSAVGVPNNRHLQKADAGDPYVELTISYTGVLADITSGH